MRVAWRGSIPRSTGHGRNGARHGGIRDAMDAECRVHDLDAQRRSDRCDGPLRRREIERDAALAEHGAIAQVAENKIGIGHSRLSAAEAVGRRSRIGAGALRSDREAACGDAGDRAAASADRTDIDHWLPDRVLAEGALVGQSGHAVTDETDVGRCAAHVEGKRRRDAELARDLRRRRRTRRWAGHGEAERIQLERLGGRHATGRVYEVQGDGIRDAGYQAVEVGGGHGHRRGRQDRGRGALVLPGLRARLVRERDKRQPRS